MNMLSTWSLFCGLRMCIQSPHQTFCRKQQPRLLLCCFTVCKLAFRVDFLNIFFILLIHLYFPYMPYAQCWSICDRFIAVRLCYLFTYFTVLHYYAALLLKVCVTEWLRPSVRLVYVHNSRTASSYKFQSWWTYLHLHLPIQAPPTLL